MLNSRSRLQDGVKLSHLIHALDEVKAIIDFGGFTVILRDTRS